MKQNDYYKLIDMLNSIQNSIDMLKYDSKYITYEQQINLIKDNIEIKSQLSLIIKELSAIGTAVNEIRDKTSSQLVYTEGIMQMIQENTEKELRHNLSKLS